MRSVVVLVIGFPGLTGLAFPEDHPLLGESNAMVYPAADSGMSLSDEGLRKAVVRAMQASSSSDGLPAITVEYPQDETVFPPDMAAPTFVWTDGTADADTWFVDVACRDRDEHVYVLTRGATPLPARDGDPRTASEAAAAYCPPTPTVPPRRWMPDPQTWERIEHLSDGSGATVTISGLSSDDPGRILSAGQTRLSVSRDPVGAPIFYRDVPLPFRHVLNNIDSIRWRLGEVSSYKPPTLLTGMKVCGNCHSFTPDGKTLGMDVDYGSDKGSYVIADIRPETVLERDKVISWSDYRRQDKEPTFGLLSQISPDGRYVISTVKDRSVFAPVDDLYYSQRFFPVTGIVVVYDRSKKQFFPLKGADDRRYVQSNPVWSPDGKTVLFARAESYTLTGLKDASSAVVEREEVAEFFEGDKKFRYDIYGVDFNDGQGGVAMPLPGASRNGMSNFFPRFSPDGKWIVFCQSDSFMLLQPDSTLCIMPAAGGTPRKMRCNFPGKMNSWHSWSPNGRWLVFASKAGGPFTQLWMTYIDANGNDSPAVLLEHFTAADRAANIPEFVNVTPERFTRIREEFADYYTHYRIGVGYEQRHEYAEAVEEFQHALSEEPNHVESLYLLASCLARLDREQEALPFALRAVQLAPYSPVAQGLMGSLLCDVGRYAEALAYLEAAHAGRSEDVSVANNLAWVLATCPDPLYRNGPRAVELARWACEATAYKSPPLLDSLAAAYAESGQFEQAIRTTEQAIEIVRTNPKASTETLGLRLELYKAGRPWHEPVRE
jgi:tetratricopeptide (TPR) repeat protein